MSWSPLLLIMLWSPLLLMTLSRWTASSIELDEDGQRMGKGTSQSSDWGQERQILSNCYKHVSCEFDREVFIKKTSAVSTTDWVVETQLCKLRDTSDTPVWCAYWEHFTYKISQHILWCLWTKPTIGLLLLFHQVLRKAVRACFTFNPHEGYRSVTPLLGDTKVNRMILHNHSVHWYY